MALICACHRYGWPVARGGSRAIADALAAVVARARRARSRPAGAVRSLDELPAADAVVLDLAPGARRRDRRRPAARPASPAPTAATATGPGAFKVDLAVEGGVPWTDRGRPPGRAPCTRSAPSRRSSRAEREVNRGRMPERPFVLVGQQYLADPSRSRGDVHPVWAYAHVPSGYDGDATEAVLDQIERFAPGLRERIVGTRRPLDRRARRLQRQLRRRRHHHRRQHAAADPVPAAPRARPLRDRHPGRLHLLGGDAARRRRPRDERLQRRRSALRRLA